MATSDWDGEGGELLKQVLQTAMHQQVLKLSEITKANVDTTVQEKVIAMLQSYQKRTLF